MKLQFYMHFMLFGIVFTLNQTLRSENKVAKSSQTKMRSIEVLSIGVTPFVVFGQSNQLDSGIEYKLLETLAEAMNATLKYTRAARINASHTRETWYC